MALTSTDAAVRRIGRRSWTVLHKTGMYVLFGIFVFSYLGPALLGRPLGIAAMGVLMGALVLRIANRMRRRR
jgi:DMSO/TMAO reductase YedYZ heme-binding membrane subunit